MVKKKKKSRGNKLTSAQLKHQIVSLLKATPKKRYYAKQVIKKLDIDNNVDSVEYAMDKLSKEGVLFHVDGKYKYDKFQGKKQTKRPTGSVKGKVDMIRSGAAYIAVEEMDEDVYVPAKFLKGALNNDIVEVEIMYSPGRRKPEGKVINIVERDRMHFLGTLNKTNRFNVVRPLQAEIDLKIFVEEEKLNGAEDGDRVVVKITKWSNNPKHNPIGIITSVLGKEGGNDMEMQSILINAGFDIGFPDEVIEESENLSTEITEEEIGRRRDMRGVTTFTIDPLTAKDFDDALSVQYLENNEIEIGIHIADVSHYIKPGTEMDKEAYQRSTSVYLVDRVAPMLPEKLSNGLCSLRPNEDKCTFSAVFTFDEKFKVKGRWFGKTMTHSDRRFTYEEAQEILESGEGAFGDELKKLNEIAYKLRKEKFKNGAISFESDEVKFKLDEDGVPIEVYSKERKDAHMLVEDFMLLANKEVAKFIHNKEKGKEIPFVYRVHDLPNPDKLGEFVRFAITLGFKGMDIQTPQKTADSFNKLAKAAKTDETLKMLEPIAIRTMSKAAYTTDNIGHYGLGFDFYSHFTSPIRRYSDVLVHRILEQNLESTFRVDKEQLEMKCKHISSQERKAMGAERESIKFKQVEFISRFIGQEFPGHVSGMIDRGIFVELDESKAEGLIGFDRFDDVFDVEEGRLKAVGRTTGKIFKMGDSVRVKILETDLDTRQIEMEIIED